MKVYKCQQFIHKRAEYLRQNYKHIALKKGFVVGYDGNYFCHCGGILLYRYTSPKTGKFPTKALLKQGIPKALLHGATKVLYHRVFLKKYYSVIQLYYFTGCSRTTMMI